MILAALAVLCFAGAAIALSHESRHEQDAAQDPSTRGSATRPATTRAAATQPATNPAVDPEYGYTAAKPIMLGSPDEFGGPAAERLYLSHLRDEQGRALKFMRLGSFGGNPDQHLVDGYEMTSADGRVFTLYLDMYHPERAPLDQPAPQGLNLMRPQEPGR